MKYHGPIHWSAYVSCAVAGVISVAMLIIGDLIHLDTLGRWGLMVGLVGAVMAAAIVADRCATKLAAEADERARAALNDLEAMMERHADRVVKSYEEQTEAIAHAVCDAVMDVFDKRHGGEATPIRRR